MTMLSRRCFLKTCWSGGESFRQAAQSGSGSGRTEYALPPEFTPALLRAEAARLGLKVDELVGPELAGAVWRAMRDGAPGANER